MAEHVYPDDQRPQVAVEIDGTWHPGELCGWWRDKDGQLLMNVAWRTEQGGTFVDTVAAERVRGISLRPTPPEPGNASDP